MYGILVRSVKNVSANKTTLPLFLFQLINKKLTTMSTITDNGSSGPVHDEYVGQIVFSKTEISKGNPNPATFTDAFTSADSIYSRVYCKHSIGYETASRNLQVRQAFYKYTIDEGNFKFSDEFARNADPEIGDAETISMWTTWQPAFNPAAGDSGYPQIQLQQYYAKLYELPEGTHTIKVELTLGDLVLASGSFNLTVSEADKEMVRQRWGTQTKEAYTVEQEAKRAKVVSSSSSSGGKASLYIKPNSSQYLIIESPGGSSTKEHFSGGSSSYKTYDVGTKIKTESGSLIATIDSNTKEVVI